MFDQTNFLESPTGAKIAWHHQPTKGEGRGIVLVSHGMAEHSKRYRHFAEFLAEHNFHTYAWDHRGHGETIAPDCIQGQFARKDGALKVVADLMAMHNFVSNQHKNLPVILFGHAMGALVGFNALLSRPDMFKGCALWNHDFSTARSVPPLRLMLRVAAFLKGSDTPANKVTQMTYGEWAKCIEDHKTPFDRLSNDDAEVAKYIADPLCGFVCTVSMWRDLTDLVLRGVGNVELARVPHDMPLHLVGGAEDPAINFGKGMNWFARHLRGSGFTNVTKIIYPRSRHETLNDIVRDEAMEDFAKWASKIAGGVQPQLAVTA